MKRTGKRLLSAALVLCLLLAALPALAEETKPEWKSVGDGAADISETAVEIEAERNTASALDNETEDANTPSSTLLMVGKTGYTYGRDAMGYSNHSWRSSNSSILQVTSSRGNYCEYKTVGMGSVTLTHHYYYRRQIGSGIGSYYIDVPDDEYFYYTVAGANLSISSDNKAFSEPFSVTIRSDAGMQIYYTLDGTTPDASSYRYSGPITIRESTVLRAVVYYNGKRVSDIKNRFFCLLGTPTLTLTDTQGLSWTAAENAEGYSVYRAGEVGKDDPRNGGEKLVDTDKTSYTDTTARVGQTYYYAVCPYTTFEGYIWQLLSNVIQTTISLRAPVLQLSRNTINNVGLTWAAVPGATEYSIYRGISASKLSWYASSANPWYSDNGAIGGTTYYYQVLPLASSDTATYGPRSNIVSATVPALAAPKLTIARNTAGNVGLSWNRIAGATGYSIYRGSGDTAPTWYASSANPWYSDTKAAPGTSYAYQVVAYTSGSTASYGGRSAIVRTNVPVYAAPVLSVAYAQPNHTGLTWNAIPGVQAYSIYRGTTANALTWYASGANPWFVDGASRPGTTYYYKVFGSATIGDRPYYTPHSAVKTVSVPVLSAPTISIVRMTAGNVGMTWNGVNGATGYSIYRGSDPASMAWYASSANPWYSDRNTVAGTTYYYQVLTYLQADGQNWYSPKSAATSVAAR